MFDPWQPWEVFAAGHRAFANLVRWERRVVSDRTNPFTAMTDSEFVERFRLRKESVHDIIVKIGDHLPQSVDRRGCRVPPHLQVLVAMATMASGSHQTVVADCFDVSQTTVSVCLSRVACAIASLIHEYITFPTGNDLQQVVEEFYAIAGMPGVIGCIDCTHIKIQRLSLNDSEVFRCRKGYLSLNIQAVCGPDLRFFNIVARWPGSVHDARIFENSLIFDELSNGRLPGHLLGDSGYANKSYLLTPLLSPIGPKEINYNASHVKTRNTVERAFGVLKRRFTCLGKTMRTELRTTQAIVVASAILHNIAVKTRVEMEDFADNNEDQNDVDLNHLVEPMSGNNEVMLGRLKREQIIRDHF